MMTVFCEVSIGQRFRACEDKDEYKKVSDNVALRYSNDGVAVDMKTEVIFHPASAVIICPSWHIWEFNSPWPNAEVDKVPTNSVDL